MDNDTNFFALDQLMQRASASALKSLDVTVDLKQSLWELFREAGIDADLAEAPSRTQ